MTKIQPLIFAILDILDAKNDYELTQTYDPDHDRSWVLVKNYYQNELQLRQSPASGTLGLQSWARKTAVVCLLRRRNKKGEEREQ